jgi:hypothetical protein
MVHRPLLAAALVVNCSALFIYCGARAVARGATRCVLHVLGLSAKANAYGLSFAGMPTQGLTAGLTQQAVVWYHA